MGAVPVRDPCAGGVVIVKLKLAGAVSASVPASVTPFAVPSFVVTLCGVAVGAVLVGLTVIDTVAAEDVSGAEQVELAAPQLSGLPRSVTVNWKLSGPKYPLFGV